MKSPQSGSVLGTLATRLTQKIKAVTVLVVIDLARIINQTWLANTYRVRALIISGFLNSGVVIIIHITTISFIIVHLLRHQNQA